jgi:hypothetical protein
VRQAPERVLEFTEEPPASLTCQDRLDRQRTGP